VLLHLTSLPGPHGHGDLGPSALRFADFLAAGEQSWWQVLPVGPPGLGESPYASPSAFAGSPWLISLETLVEDGLLDRADLERPARRLREDRAAFGPARRFREPRLRKAFARFEQRPGRRRAPLEAFRQGNRSWLEDYALYCALDGAHGGAPWTAWDPELRSRRRGALERARRALAGEVRYHAFLQHQFDRQWSRLRRHCRDRGIGLMGDLPIFVAHHSADVWAHQELFRLDGSGRPTVVAGIPPDYFSRTGQLWGNPVYRWDVLRRRGYDWWLARLEAVFQRFDAVRLDHFVGFQRFWEVPASARTAIPGRWAPGPGADFFEAVFRRLGRVQLIAEDLGVLTPEVKALRDGFGLPGMRVLQFAFGNDPEAESYRPHTYPAHTVAYTGTHDNDTTVGWFRDRGSRASTRSPAEIRAERRFALRYLGSDGREIHWDMIRLASMSPANTVIVPFQDLLGLGSEARLNSPGTPSGNWAWRLSRGALAPSLSRRLGELTVTYGRARAR
jgi:4-alpha-glucanotransferase